MDKIGNMSYLFDFSERITGIDVSYKNIERNKSTFISGLEKSFHSWFRLTPSFGPDMVRTILKEFKADNDKIILDPFAGASTTLIEAKLLGYKSYGFEINPFLYFVGKTNLNWNIDINSILAIRNEIIKKFYLLQYQYINFSCEELPYELPRIHNVYRWWRPDVLKDLLILKYLINIVAKKHGAEYRDFLFLALAGVLIPELTNVTLGKLQLHFVDKLNEKMNVIETFLPKLNMMISDLANIDKNKKLTTSSLFLIDSTNISSDLLPEKIDIVITSPPYPNRYSYVWNTRPYLYLFDIFSNAKEASELDLKTIGGTWGTATSILSKGIIYPINNIIDELVGPTAENIRKVDNMMANYIMKYFNMLYTQINKMLPLLSNNVKILYVVGNSEIKGTFVETDVILSNIFKKIGFSSTNINRFRKRNSGKNLFESNVYAS